MQSALEPAPPQQQGGMLTQDHELLQALPTAVYTTDAAGRITFYNEAAARLWGHRPKLGTSEWCGSWRLYWPDGTPLPHDQCPMATALKEQRPISGAQAVCEREDGTRISFLAFPRPLRDARGAVVGAINTLVDVTSLKTAEDAVHRRAHDQSALYRFTNSLYRAGSLPDIYDAALDAILDTLGCRSASILRFDDADVMRFVAWRGLSEDYRKAVDGHSPWKAGDRNPEPICIGDVEKADLPDDLRNASARKAFERSLSFRSLQRRCGRKVHDLLRQRRAFDPANHRACGHDSAPARLQPRTSRSRNQPPCGSGGVAGKRGTAARRLQFVRRSGSRCSRRMGRSSKPTRRSANRADITANELRSRRFAASLTHPDDRAAMQALLDELLDGRSPSFVIEKRYRRKDGSVIWVQNSVSLTHDEAGRPLHLVKLIQNITERKVAEKRQRLLIDEINHRVKNTLATVQSFATQTLRNAPQRRRRAAKRSKRG